MTSSEKTPANSAQRIFQQIFHAAPHPALVSRMEDGCIVDVNESCLRILGYERDAIIGRTSADVGLFANLEERDSIIKRLAQDGAVRDVVIHTRAQSGSIHPLRVSVERLDINDSPLILWLAEDITARSKLDAQLALTAKRWRSTFDAIEEMVVIFDPDRNVLDANRAMRELIGTEEIAGRSCYDVFNGRLDSLANAADLDVFASGMTVQLAVQEASMGNRWFDLHAYACNDDADHMYQVVVIVRDITERRQLEDQLRHAQKMEAVGRLAGGVAHDFNNLLTAITGYSELILSRLKADDPMRMEVEEIKSAGDRAASLTSQLLAFGRKQMLQPTDVCINDLLKDMNHILSRMMGENVELTMNLAPDLGNVRADPVQLQQVFINLAVNARDAMAEGGEVEILTANVDFQTPTPRDAGTIRPGNYISLAMRDSGAGMDEVTRTHLFEPFYTTKQDGEGLGLGLSTVYGIVKQSGGHVDVESELDKGTTFTVYLPRIMEANNMSSDSRSVANSLRGTETILLVEDEDAVRKLASTILRSHGYRVIEAEGGVEALRICRLHQGDIHLLLSDVVLPRVSGPSVAERMVDFKPGTKVLFMSGYTEESSLLKSILKKDAAFLPKPFTPEALAAKVREVLDAPLSTEDKELDI
jgi:PAS domain S-box-containing protein